MNQEEIQERVEAAYSELVSALEAGKSETLVEYLRMCSKFHRYSFNNCVLIYCQKSDATFVAGFTRWRELNRFVRKGEKGIAILAPVIRKRAIEVEEGGVSKAHVVRALSGFRLVYVYDVSQTDGEPLAEFAASHGEPGELISQMEVVIKERGITLSYQTLGGANGVSEGGVIRVDSTLSSAETFRVLVHELAHEILHQGTRRQVTTKTVRELEAEAVAFIVASSFGIDSSTRSSDYIQLYSGDKEGLIRSLEFIQKTASTIILELDALRKEGAHAVSN